jgi:hypothetical protein
LLFSKAALIAGFPVPLIFIAKIANPHIDLLARMERRERSEIRVKRVRFLPFGPKDCAAILEDELHAIPFLETQPMANLDWNGHLTFTADGAG